MILERVGNSGSAYVVAQVSETVPNRGVASEWILPGHFQHQFGDDLHDPRAPRTFTAVSPLPGNECTMPTQDGVGRHDIGNLKQNLAAQSLAENGQSASLVIIELGPLSAELFFQNAVLLVKVVDDSLLMSI